jgi:AbrB family looped-hinge helix DNA binding protein
MQWLPAESSCLQFNNKGRYSMRAIKRVGIVVLPNLTVSLGKFMETTKLSSKGQIILPKSVCESHHWQPGMEFIVEDRPEGVLLRPAKPFQPTRLQDVIGIAGYAGPAKTLEDMEKAIAQGTLERHACGRY